MAVFLSQLALKLTAWPKRLQSYSKEKKLDLLCKKYYNFHPAAWSCSSLDKKSKGLGYSLRTWTSSHGGERRTVHPCVTDYLKLTDFPESKNSRQLLKISYVAKDDVENKLVGYVYTFSVALFLMLFFFFSSETVFWLISSCICSLPSSATLWFWSDVISCQSEWQSSLPSNSKWRFRS